MHSHTDTDTQKDTHAHAHTHTEVLSQQATCPRLLSSVLSRHTHNPGPTADISFMVSALLLVVSFHCQRKHIRPAHAS